MSGENHRASKSKAATLLGKLLNAVTWALREFLRPGMFIQQMMETDKQLISSKLWADANIATVKTH